MGMSATDPPVPINKAHLDAQRIEAQETETIVLSKAEFAELVQVEDPTGAE